MRKEGGVSRYQFKNYVAALPPDVRKGSAFSARDFFSGLRPEIGRSPLNWTYSPVGLSPTAHQAAEPNQRFGSLRGAGSRLVESITFSAASFPKAH